uniref:Interferon gamma receptor 1-like n=1 Tax=Fundulus heteroclitus TaxID=8078 RepID=A0A3Q2R0N8_FUNHE
MTPTKCLLCLLLLPAVSSAQVAPPTNVTLTCRSLQNILTWDYADLRPGLGFLVTIGSDSELQECPKEIWVEQPPLQANVSFLSDPDSTYLLRVKAVQGGNESLEEDVTFSYFHGALDSQKCVLDLPHVTVTPLEHNQIAFEFQHPWLVYKDGLNGCKKPRNKKRPRGEPKLPPFEYYTNISGQEVHSECEDAKCQEKRPVAVEKDEHCLEIRGTLRKMSVESKEYCTQKAPPLLNVAALVVGLSLVLVAAAALVIFMVCWKKTTPSKTLLRHLDFTSRPTHPGCVLLDTDSPQETVIVTPLVNNGDVSEKDDIPSPPGSTEYDLRIKLCPDAQGLSEDPADENTPGERNPYMDGKSIDDEPSGGPESDQESRTPYESRSAYEKRSVVLELAPEDHAEGYRG